MAEASASLVEQVLAGGNRQLQLMAADGLLPIPPADLIPVQVALTRGDDEEIAHRATAGLRGLEPRMVAEYLRAGASADELAFFAMEGDHPMVLEAVLRRRDAPPPLLVAMAPNLNEDLQEVLILRQDAILEEPRILEALERNPQLSDYARRRILEYRKHLLPREKPERPAPAPGELEEATDEEVIAALAEARQVEPQGEHDDSLNLSEAQIRAMPAPVRLRLTSGASRSLRGILLKDPNPQVALAVLNRNAVTDSEAEQIASSRSVVEEVLEYICRRREWVSKYAVMHNLVRNPRTPLAYSVKMVPRLSVRDLRNLSKDRNVPDAVRSTALRLYRIKSR